MVCAQTQSTACLATTQQTSLNLLQCSFPPLTSTALENGVKSPQGAHSEDKQLTCFVACCCITCFI